MPPEEECPKCKAGVPDWVVTFSDLMTLLLTFFVLLLSMSETTTIKYERAAESLHEAFAGFNVLGQPVVSMVEIPELKPTHKQVKVIEDEKATNDNLSSTKNKDKDKDNDFDSKRKAQVIEAVEQIVKEELKKEMDMGFAQLESDNNRVLIRFPADVFFKPGSDIINKKMLPTVEKLALGLKGFFINTVISGHTDSLPIKTTLFRSNWDLSARRAASIAHVFEDKADFTSAQMEVKGFADGRPLNDNSTKENRAKNRRVEVEIEPSDQKFTEDVFQKVIEKTIGKAKPEEIELPKLDKLDTILLPSAPKELKPSKLDNMIDKIKNFGGKRKSISDSTKK